jgi:hypothetical protein
MKYQEDGIKQVSNASDELKGPHENADSIFSRPPCEGFGSDPPSI